MSESVTVSHRVKSGTIALEVLHATGTVSDFNIRCGSDGLPTYSRLLRFGRWAAVLFEQSLAACRTIELEFKGADLDANMVRVIDHPACPAPRASGCSVNLTKDGSLDRRCSSLLNALEQASLSDGDECGINPRLVRAARYFLDLDYETASAIRVEPRTRRRGGAVISDEELAFRWALIERDGGFGRRTLWGRFMQRLAGQTPDRGNVNRTHVAYLSALQLEVLDAHYGVSERESIRLAFEAFAAGDLFLRTLPTVGNARDTIDTRLSNGGPNSVLLYLFAEFAFIAIELGVDAERWRRIFPALVASQDVFPHAYGQITDGAIEAIDSSQYQPESALNLMTGARRVAPRIRERIRRKYVGMGLDDLNLAATANIQTAIRQIGRMNLLPAPPR